MRLFQHLHLAQSSLLPQLVAGLQLRGVLLSYDEQKLEKRRGGIRDVKPPMVIIMGHTMGVVLVSATWAGVGEQQWVIVKRSLGISARGCEGTRRIVLSLLHGRCQELLSVLRAMCYMITLTFFVSPFPYNHLPLSLIPIWYLAWLVFVKSFESLVTEAENMLCGVALFCS